jgi:predicted P-loop ATPase
LMLRLASRVILRTQRRCSSKVGRGTGELQIVPQVQAQKVLLWDTWPWIQDQGSRRKSSARSTANQAGSPQTSWVTEIHTGGQSVPQWSAKPRKGQPLRPEPQCSEGRHTTQVATRQLSTPDPQCGPCL